MVPVLIVDPDLTRSDQRAGERTFDLDRVTDRLAEERRESERPTSLKIVADDASIVLKFSTWAELSSSKRVIEFTVT